MKLYHITEIKNLFGEDGIAKKGLVPQCGDRSKSIGDTRCAVSLTSSYESLKSWKLYLYPNVKPDDLCILQVDIDKQNIKNYENKTEFYTNILIPPEKINVVKFYDSITNEPISFLYLYKNDFNDYLNKIPIKIKTIETPVIKYVEKLTRAKKLEDELKRFRDELKYSKERFENLEGSRKNYK